MACNLHAILIEKNPDLSVILYSFIKTMAKCNHSFNIKNEHLYQCVV
jgi:hypothetical protein